MTAYDVQGILLLTPIVAFLIVAAQALLSTIRNGKANRKRIFEHELKYKKCSVENSAPPTYDIVYRL